MPSARGFQVLADAVLAVHFAVVVLVVGGLLLIVLGNLRHWRWVNRWWFRLCHLAAIAFVVAQAWLGQTCPLTTLENWLRLHASQPGYQRSFIEHWLQAVLFYQAAPWVFTLAYSVFGLLVVATWLRYPPLKRYK
jgi:Protein of Unknown function (DUF2784)